MPHGIMLKKMGLFPAYGHTAELCNKMLKIPDELQGLIWEMLPREDQFIPWFDKNYEKLAPLAKQYFDQRDEGGLIKFVEGALAKKQVASTLNKAHKTILDLLKRSTGSIHVICRPIFDGSDYFISAERSNQSENIKIEEVILVEKLSSEFVSKNLKFQALNSKDSIIHHPISGKAFSKMSNVYRKSISGFESELDLNFTLDERVHPDSMKIKERKIKRVCINIPTLVDNDLLGPKGKGHLRKMQANFLANQELSRLSRLDEFVGLLFVSSMKKGESKAIGIFEDLIDAVKIDGLRG